jgi:hypothetical protein
MPVAQIREVLAHLAPVAVTVTLVVLGLFAAHWALLGRKKDLEGERRLGRQTSMALLTGVGAALVVLSLPTADTTKAQLLSLLGLVATGVLGISSTTFVSNAMAGLMLRALGRFDLGDFIRSQDYFGRITERGIFYTEIQTEDRDLVRLPNLFLVTQPFKLIRGSGTIVSANVTLGYDVPHDTVRSLLLQAAEAADLTEPFVHIVDLGDHAVGYRVAGLLSDVNRLLTVRSLLRECMLDSLQGHGVEIVSPSFMNQRALDPDSAILPSRIPLPPRQAGRKEAESVMFDKADAAAQVGELKRELGRIEKEIEALELAKSGASGHERAGIDRSLGQHRGRREWIRDALATAESDLTTKPD